MPPARKLKGFYVQCPSLSDRIAELTHDAARSSKENKEGKPDKEIAKELEKLVALAKSPPKPPPPLMQPTGTVARMPPPPVDPPPTIVPFRDWEKAVRIFKVLKTVTIRDRPHLMAEKLGLLKKDTYFHSERETDHWVKLRGRRGWVLKVQGKHGQLVMPLKQQGYEEKWASACAVDVTPDGSNPIQPSPFKMPQRSGGRKVPLLEGSALHLPKRIVVTQGLQIKGLAAQKRSAAAEDYGAGGGGGSSGGGNDSSGSRRMGPLQRFAPPPPPPRGWDVLFDPATHRNYYRRLVDDEVRWDLPDASDMSSGVGEYGGVTGRRTSVL